MKHIPTPYDKRTGSRLAVIVMGVRDLQKKMRNCGLEFISIKHNKKKIIAIKHRKKNYEK